MKAKIINNSLYLNPEFLDFVVRFVCNGINKKLPKFSVEYGDVSFDENAITGERIYNPDVEWDGTAWDDNRVQITIKEGVEFPLLLNINKHLKGRYLQQTFINSLDEFLVWITSHEIFHIYQWNNPDELGLGKQFGADDETSSDLFAAITLNKWRYKYGG